MLRKSSLSACPPPNSCDISIGFHYDDLERFLSNSVALYCNDTELAALARAAASGLSNQWQQTQGIESIPDDVANVANILDAFIAMTSRSGAATNNNNNNQNDGRSSNNNNNRKHINSTSTRPLPAHVVYEVHSFMGLLNLAQKNESAAKVSFMKALWITAAMSADPISKQQHQPGNGGGGGGGGSHELALTLHRLGKIHARSAVASSKSPSSSSSSTKANYDEAKCLLTRAIEEYEKKTAPGSSKDHYLLLDARRELQQMESQRRKQLMEEEGSRSSILSSRAMMHQSLPFILEEGDSIIEPAAERRRSSAI